MIQVHTVFSLIDSSNSSEIIFEACKSLDLLQYILLTWMNVQTIMVGANMNAKIRLVHISVPVTMDLHCMKMVLTAKKAVVNMKSQTQQELLRLQIILNIILQEKTVFGTSKRLQAIESNW